MRIDLNAPTSEAPDPGQSTKSASQVGSGSTKGAGLAGADTASLSQDQGKVQELASQVNQMPEIRQDKVAALKSAIQQGSYQVTSGQAAEALLAAIQVSSAA
jgi:negative regulator of flagellin synthesis FlgM